MVKQQPRIKRFRRYSASNPTLNGTHYRQATLHTLKKLNCIITTHPLLVGTRSHVRRIRAYNGRYPRSFIYSVVTNTAPRSSTLPPQTHKRRFNLRTRALFKARAHESRQFTNCQTPGVCAHVVTEVLPIVHGSTLSWWLFRNGSDQRRLLPTHALVRRGGRVGCPSVHVPVCALRDGLLVPRPRLR